MDLDEIASQKAKQSGISQKQMKKAMKKLKSGGMMSQIAPQLQGSFMEMNPNLSPREKLHTKLKNMKEGRLSKYTKDINFEKQKEEVYKRKENEEKEKLQAKEAAKRKERNHKKRLRELEKQVGKVSLDMYVQAIKNQESNQYTDQGLSNRDRNLIELYTRQQEEFKDKIDLADLDDLELEHEPGPTEQQNITDEVVDQYKETVEGRQTSDETSQKCC